MVLRRLDLWDAFGRATEPDLFISSAANLAVRSGMPFEHHIVAKSKRRGITFALVRVRMGSRSPPKAS